MKALDIAKKEKRDDGRTWYVAQADDLYRQMAAFAAAAVENKAAGDFAPADRRYFSQANRLGKGKIKAALCSRDDSKDVKARSEVLTLLRLWFASKLHREMGGGPLGLHIVDTEKFWKL